MCVFIFSTNFSETFLILRTEHNNDQNCTLNFIWSACYSFPILNKLEICRQFFAAIHQYQISWKSVQWEPSYTTRTDRHDEANSRLSQFWESATNTASESSYTFKFGYLCSHICVLSTRILFVSSSVPRVPTAVLALMSKSGARATCHKICP
jgi:hypothetical protein